MSNLTDSMTLYETEGTSYVSVKEEEGLGAGEKAAEQGSLSADFSARKLPAAVASYDAYRPKLFCASLVNKPGWILKIFWTMASAILIKGYNKKLKY